MPLKRLQSLLDEQHVPYRVIDHPLSFTASETAQAAHIPGAEVLKTVMVKLDGRMTMVAVPSSKKVNLGRLRKATGASEAMLADEQEFGALFPDCDTGAMPPFGDLYGLEVLADQSLTRDEAVAFNAGSHTELVQLTWADYARLAHPRIIALG